jgi:hypothetical protein
MPWRPIHLWDAEALKSSRQWAHRWWWGFKPYAPAGLFYPPGRFLVLISGYSAAGRIWPINPKRKIQYLIGNRTRDLPACNSASSNRLLRRCTVLRAHTCGDSKFKNINSRLFILCWFHKPYLYCCWSQETETSSIYWAQLPTLHLKTETESSLRNVVF